MVDVLSEQIQTLSGFDVQASERDGNSPNDIHIFQ